MIDPLSEKVLTLSQAAKSLPKRRAGRRPHVSCLYRWTVSGLRGVVLESIQIGGTRCTSREALARFFDRLSNRSGSLSTSNTRSTAQRERDVLKTELALTEMGILRGPVDAPPSLEGGTRNKRRGFTGS
jgi:hypothetical protein